MLPPACTSTAKRVYRSLPRAFGFASDIAPLMSSASGYSTNCVNFPRPNGTYSNRFNCTVSTNGAVSIVNCFVARVMCGLPPPISHLYLLLPSSTSTATYRFNADSTLLALATSSDRSINESKVSLLRPHVLHVTCDRSRPPNTWNTNVVSARGEFFGGLGLAASTHFSCIASRRHLANSCASSCRPLRKVLDIDRRFLTNAEGDTTLRSPPSALHTCSPISYIALNDCEFVRGLNRRCSPSRQKDASAGVCVRHCITAFMKHVLPRLARPLPTLRTDGHAMRMRSRG